MHLPKNEGGDFELTPAGTFPARCYQFIDAGSHEQTFQGESKGLKRLVIVRFELPTELMKDGRPFSIGKRWTWSTHEKATMRKDLESWRGAKFRDSDFGPGGFDVKNLLGVTATLTIVHNEKEEKTYANIMNIGKAMRGVDIPPQFNKSIYLSLDHTEFDREVFGSLHEKLQKFIGESPEYRSLVDGPKSNGYKQQSGGDGRQFAPMDEMDQEIPFMAEWR